MSGKSFLPYVQVPDNLCSKSVSDDQYCYKNEYSTGPLQGQRVLPNVNLPLTYVFGLNKAAVELLSPSSPTSLTSPARQLSPTSQSNVKGTIKLNQPFDPCPNDPYCLQGSQHDASGNSC